MITILKIERPLPGNIVWYGTATSARRFYEWFYFVDDGRVRVRAEEPNMPGCFMNLRRTPKRFREAVLQAVERTAA